MAKPKTGRASLFRGKKGGRRIQGIVTRRGGELFEMRRRWLASLTNRKQREVSDADVIEYLARGEKETLKYLKL